MTGKCQLNKVIRVLPLTYIPVAIAIEKKILRKAEKFSGDVSHVARDSIARRKHSKRLRTEVYSRA